VSLAHELAQGASSPATGRTPPLASPQASPPARDPGLALAMAASSKNVTLGGGGRPLPSSLDRLAALQSSLDLRAIS